jgi:hypothetical protein
MRLVAGLTQLKAGFDPMEIVLESVALRFLSELLDLHCACFFFYLEVKQLYQTDAVDRGPPRIRYE